MYLSKNFGSNFKSGESPIKIRELLQGLTTESFGSENFYVQKFEVLHCNRFEER